MAKCKTRATRLSEAINAIREQLGTVEELKQELEDWQSNMQGTNLEATMKYEELEEAVSQLDAVNSEIESACETAESIEFPRAF